MPNEIMRLPGGRGPSAMRSEGGFVHVILLLSSLAMVVAAVFVALSLMASEVESGEERVLRGGPIRIGYAWVPPYAYRNDDGRVTGESPEVARAVLARTGIRDAEWVQTDFGNLITELRAGRFDMIAAGMFVTPERSERIAFSTPSACLEPALLVRRGNPLDLHSLQEIAAHYSARLAVLAGAVEAADAREAGIPDSRIVPFFSSDLPSLFQLVLIGNVFLYIYTRHFDFFRITQFGLFLFLPFFAQWSAGNLIVSSGVILWGALAPHWCNLVYWRSGVSRMVYRVDCPYSDLGRSGL